MFALCLLFTGLYHYLETPDRGQYFIAFFFFF